MSGEEGPFNAAALIGEFIGQKENASIDAGQVGTPSKTHRRHRSRPENQVDTPKRKAALVGHSSGRKMTPLAKKIKNDAAHKSSPVPTPLRNLQAEDNLSLLSPSRRDLKKMNKEKLVDENLLLVERNRAMEDIQVHFSSDFVSLREEIASLKNELTATKADRDQWMAKAQEYESREKRTAEREWRSFVSRQAL